MTLEQAVAHTPTAIFFFFFEPARVHDYSSLSTQYSCTVAQGETSHLFTVAGSHNLIGQNEEVLLLRALIDLPEVPAHN
jgi:hypothetical protein